MPLIDAYCSECLKVVQDIWVKRTDEKVNCPDCGKKLEKLPSRTSWQWGRR